jgi:hypothetical protein
MARRSEVRIAYPSGFDTQSDFETPLSAGAIDAVFDLSDEDPKLELVTNKGRILDCSGRYLLKTVLNSRYYRLTFGINIEPAVLFGLFGWGLGTVAGDEVTLMTGFQPPATTLIYGHVDSDQDPLLLKSMVLMKIVITANATTGYTASFEFRGHGNPDAATGYTFPECSDVTPVRFRDGAFSVNSVDYLADTTSYTFTFDNKPDDADPFTIAGPDITRNESADERQHDLAWVVAGKTGDALDAASKTDPPTEYPFSFRIGPLSDGITVAAARANFGANGGETYNGTFKRSVLNFLLEPEKISGNADTPLLVTRET